MILFIYNSGKCKLVYLDKKVTHSRGGAGGSESKGLGHTTFTILTMILSWVYTCQHLDFNQELPFWKTPSTPGLLPPPSPFTGSPWATVGLTHQEESPSGLKDCLFQSLSTWRSWGVGGCSTGREGWRATPCGKDPRRRGFSSSLRMSEIHRDSQDEGKSQDM